MCGSEVGIGPHPFSASHARDASRAQHHLLSKPLPSLIRRKNEVVQNPKVRHPSIPLDLSIPRSLNLTRGAVRALRPSSRVFRLVRNPVPLATVSLLPLHVSSPISSPSFPRRSGWVCALTGTQPPTEASRPSLPQMASEERLERAPPFYSQTH